jgi:DNA-binding NarL/FixJ family response regulator
LDPRATKAVLERLRKGAEPQDPRFASLSPQEKRILELIADGLTNRQIGAEMYLAEKTVKNYVSSLLHKLGMSRRTEPPSTPPSCGSARTSSARLTGASVPPSR